MVVTFLDRLGLSHATLVAHDRAGPIGLYAAEQRPAPQELSEAIGPWSAKPESDAIIQRAERPRNG